MSSAETRSMLLERVHRTEQKRSLKQTSRLNAALAQEEHDLSRRPAPPSAPLSPQPEPDLGSRPESALQPAAQLPAAQEPNEHDSLPLSPARQRRMLSARRNRPVSGFEDDTNLFAPRPRARAQSDAPTPQETLYSRHARNRSAEHPQALEPARAVSASKLRRPQHTNTSTANPWSHDTAGAAPLSDPVEYGSKLEDVRLARASARSHRRKRDARLSEEYYSDQFELASAGADGFTQPTPAEPALRGSHIARPVTSPPPETRRLITPPPAAAKKARSRSRSRAQMQHEEDEALAGLPDSASLSPHQLPKGDLTRIGSKVKHPNRSSVPLSYTSQHPDEVGTWPGSSPQSAKHTAPSRNRDSQKPRDDAFMPTNEPSNTHADWQNEKASEDVLIDDGEESSRGSSVRYSSHPFRPRGLPHGSNLRERYTHRRGPSDLERAASLRRGASVRRTNSGLRHLTGIPAQRQRSNRGPVAARQLADEREAEWADEMEPTPHRHKSRGNVSGDASPFDDYQSPPKPPQPPVRQALPPSAHIHGPLPDEQPRSNPHGDSAMLGANLRQGDVRPSAPKRRSFSDIARGAFGLGAGAKATEMAAKARGGDARASDPRSGSPQDKPRSDARGSGPQGRPRSGGDGAEQQKTESGKPSRPPFSERYSMHHAQTPNPFRMKRTKSLTGVDQMFFLIEDEVYHSTTFSIYMFESVLDTPTVVAFFEKLVQLFPKYRYVLEMDPRQAEERDHQALHRLARGPPDLTPPQHHKESLQGGNREMGESLPDEPVTSAAADDRQRLFKEAGIRARMAHFDNGRRTKWTRTLKVGSKLRPAKWRILDDFDVRENIEELGCVAPDNGDDALFDIAGKFLARHYNYAKPLWEALIVRGIETKDGSRSALMIKIHHGVADGQGLIQSYGVALEAMVTGASKAEVMRKYETQPGRKVPGQRGVKPSLGGTMRHGVRTVKGLYFRRRKDFTYSEPSKRVYGRRYAHSEGITMSDIKLVREAFSSPDDRLTLNDVACAVLSKAMTIAASKANEDGPVPKDKRIPILVPISLRRQGDYSLSNLTTGAIAWFTLDPSMSAGDRLQQVHKEMNIIKKSYLPRVWYEMADLISARRMLFVPSYPLGHEFFEKAYREYQVATNVPGPPKAVKFGEHTAQRYFVLPPSSPGKSALAIGMISYAGEFSVAIACDDVPAQYDLARNICDAFHQSSLLLVADAKEHLAQRGHMTNGPAADHGTAHETAFIPQAGPTSPQGRGPNEGRDPAPVQGGGVFPWHASGFGPSHAPAHSPDGGDIPAFGRRVRARPNYGSSYAGSPSYVRSPLSPTESEPYSPRPPPRYASGPPARPREEQETPSAETDGDRAFNEDQEPSLSSEEEDEDADEFADARSTTMEHATTPGPVPAREQIPMHAQAPKHDLAPAYAQPPTHAPPRSPSPDQAATPSSELPPTPPPKGPSAPYEQYASAGKTQVSLPPLPTAEHLAPGVSTHAPLSAPTYPVGLPSSPATPYSPHSGSSPSVPQPPPQRHPASTGYPTGYPMVQAAQNDPAPKRATSRFRREPGRTRW